MYGFDGNETHCPGTILLSVRANPYNVITEFYVVDVESPDNAIRGRPWLHIMKVVPFTYHQLLRYPPTGMADIRDQVAARTTPLSPRRTQAGSQRLRMQSPRRASQEKEAEADCY